MSARDDLKRINEEENEKSSELGRILSNPQSEDYDDYQALYDPYCVGLRRYFKIREARGKWIKK